MGENAVEKTDLRVVSKVSSSTVGGASSRAERMVDSSN